MKQDENKNITESLKEIIVEKLKKEGITFILLIGLFFYMINDAKIREEKYQNTNKELANIIATELKEIKSDVKEIKVEVRNGVVRQ